MPSDTLQLHDRLTRLILAPAMGASIVNWSTRQGGLPLLRHSDDDARASGSPRRLACYPLAPWSNRIAGGGFSTPGGWLALAANTDDSPLPIHGSAWQQPWQVVHHTPASAVLRLDSRLPFAYRAEQRIGLHEGRLDIQLAVTHLDAAPNWHGLGLHPYFPRTPHTRLQARASKVWRCDTDRLSTQLDDLPPAWNFHQPHSLPLLPVDNAFSGWDGGARIIEPEAGYRLDIRAEGCGLFLLFCPQAQPFFCFEPVTHPVNAHHLPGRPGLVLLSQGQRLQLRLSLHYQPRQVGSHAEHG